MRQVYGLSEDQNVITLQRFSGHININTSLDCEKDVRGIFLDVETTGTIASRDKIINLGYILFTFEKSTGRIIRLEKEFNQLEDPKEKLSPIITKLTGYKDEDLVGKAIDWIEVEEDFKSADIIIAHNAQFDRGFLDKYLPISRDKIWACSMSQINWREKGHGSCALEFLAKDHGFFFDGHTALIDAKASFYLLTLINPETKKDYFSELLEQARIPMKWVYAFGSDFSIKDELRDRGYRWERSEKVWRKKVPLNSNEEEEFILNHPLAGSSKIKHIPLKENFKSDSSSY